MKRGTAILPSLFSPGLVALALVIFLAFPSGYAYGNDAADIEVSRDDRPGGFDQQHPGVALRGDGSLVVVWSDTRNGDGDIYCRIYSPSGGKLGGSFRVNDDNAGAEQKFPRIAAAKDGSFAISWMDNRGGDWDIYLQIYDRNGNPMGGNLLVNDDRSGVPQLYPDLSALPDGGFEVRWTDWRGPGVSVYRQRYDAGGRRLGRNKADRKARARKPFGPAVSSNSSGYSVTAWNEGYGKGSDIYCQIRDASGGPIGGAFKVNDDPPGSEQSFPDVSVAEDGSFAVVWMDKRNSPYDYDIYCQRYDASGKPIGGNFRVSDEGPGVNQTSPGIDVAPDGSCVVVWSEYEGGSYNIRYRKFGRDGTPLSEGVIGNRPAYRGSPDVCLFGDGSFLISWDSDEDGNYDVYCQRFSPSGKPSAEGFKASDDSSGAVQAKPASAASPDGSSLVCWIDERERLDIYCQLFDSSGRPVGGNRLLFKATDETEPYEVSVAAGGEGGFSLALRTGCECGGENNGIYFIGGYIPGREPGPAIRVNDNREPSNRMWVDLGTSGDGGTVVCWADRRDGDWDIYCQRFDRFGNPIGKNFKVNDEGRGSDQKNPRIAVAYNGSFAVVWVDYRNGPSDPDIYARIYDGRGKPLGRSFRVNTDKTRKGQLSPDVGTDGLGNFYFVWQDSRTPGHGYDIRMRKMSFKASR